VKGKFLTIDDIKALGGSYVPPKPRKPRAVETAPRTQHEAIFRREVVKHLRKKWCVVKRVENGIGGDLGRDIPDLWVFNSRTKWAGWVELKSKTGTLTGNQPLFKDLCNLCGVNHIVARTLSDLEIIYAS
jgi:hypothetical protein